MNLRPQRLLELRNFILDDYFDNKYKVRVDRWGGGEGGEGRGGERTLNARRAKGRMSEGDRKIVIEKENRINDPGI